MIVLKSRKIICKGILFELFDNNCIMRFEIKSLTIGLILLVRRGSRLELLFHKRKLDIYLRIGFLGDLFVVL